jgi:succinate dehydrogenase/fumarate reductase flavoprotein subunit
MLENAELMNIRTIETLNMAYIAACILESALARKQSCGSHYRVD